LIRRKALGDALVTMPAVLEVARAWPRARLDLVIDRPFAPLFEGLVPEVRVLAFPPPEGTSWWRGLRSAGYDLVIDWLGNPRTALWTWWTAAPVRVGYDLPRRRWAYNVRVPRNEAMGRPVRGFAGEAFFDPLRHLGLDPEPWRPGFARDRRGDDTALGADYRQWVGEFFGRDDRVAALMFSATWAAKGWPHEHAAGLWEGLRDKGWRPLLVHGPGDEAILEGVRGRIPDEFVAPPTNLPELADLLGRCRLFIGTDCGARHLAAGLGKPTVTLFGPTDPAGWNPAGPGHVSVRTGEDCSPCDLTACPVPGHPCMTGLTPEMVLKAVDRVDGTDKPKDGTP
jgi:ADP-heptose:LPS heptosyltransferase